MILNPPGIDRVLFSADIQRPLDFQYLVDMAVKYSIPAAIFLVKVRGLIGNKINAVTDILGGEPPLSRRGDKFGGPDHHPIYSTYL